MSVAIITAIYDNYDTLKPAVKQKNIDVEWICVTDDPYWARDKVYRGWKCIYEPRPHLHPNRAAKTPKCLPWLYTDASASIWIDASYQVISESFAEDVLSYADPIAQFSHPWRQCAYEEADESLKLPKYEDQYPLIREQRWCLDQIYNHPKGYGLWATGVIARKHTPQVINMGFDWLSQIYQYSYQDQLSHPNALRIHVDEMNNLPGTHLSNEWLEYKGSGRH